MADEAVTGLQELAPAGFHDLISAALYLSIPLSFGSSSWTDPTPNPALHSPGPCLLLRTTAMLLLERSRGQELSRLGCLDCGASAGSKCQTLPERLTASPAAARLRALSCRTACLVTAIQYLLQLPDSMCCSCPAACPVGALAACSRACS